MPGLHRIQDSVGKFVISPFLGLALLTPFLGFLDTFLQLLRLC